MDRAYVAENEAERARLQAVVARLTDADMACAVSEDWTVGVGLMHLAFWVTRVTTSYTRVRSEAGSRVQPLRMRQCTEAVNFRKDA
jgi:hypothetical protein